MLLCFVFLVIFSDVMDFRKSVFGFDTAQSIAGHDDELKELADGEKAGPHAQAHHAT